MRNWTAIYDVIPELIEGKGIMFKGSITPSI